MKTTTQLKRTKWSLSSKKKTKRKMVKKHANKSHYNFDNLNVVNLKTKRKLIKNSI